VQILRRFFHGCASLMRVFRAARRQAQSLAPLRQKNTGKMWYDKPSRRTRAVARSPGAGGTCINSARERHMKHPLILALCGLLALTGAATADEDADTRIARAELAGRQNALSHRLSRAICFMAIDSFAEQHLDMLVRARAGFDNTLEQLQRISPDQKIATDRIAAAWKDMQPLVTRVSEAGRASRADANEVAAAATQLAAATSAFFAGSTRSGDLPPARQEHLNLVALVLTQSARLEQAATQSCLIRADIERSDNQQALRRTTEAFQRDSTVLVFGQKSSGIPHPQTWEIYARIRFVTQDWIRVGIYYAIAMRRTPSATKMDEIAQDVDPMQRRLGELIEMYHQL
jgi:hypothetical protein